MSGPQGTVSREDRFEAPKLRNDFVHLELRKVSVANMPVGLVPNEGELRVLSHLQVKWKEGVVVVKQGADLRTPMLWMGCAKDDDDQSVQLDVKMRQRPAKMQQQQQQQRFQARSEGPAGSVGATEIDAQATTPFNTRHTGDDAGGVTLRTKNDAEQAMFEHYTRTHSEIDLEINAPALRGHFSANEFQSLYALLIDLSMHEPWTCPAPAAGAAAGERSGMRSSSSTSSTAGTGEPLAGSVYDDDDESDVDESDGDNDDAAAAAAATAAAAAGVEGSRSDSGGIDGSTLKPSFVSVTVIAGQVAVMFDEGSVTDSVL